MHFARAMVGIDDLVGCKEITRLVLRDPNEYNTEGVAVELKEEIREKLIYMKSASAGKSLRIFAKWFCRTPGPRPCTGCKQYGHEDE